MLENMRLIGATTEPGTSLHFVEALMEATLPWLKLLVVAIILWGVTCAAIRLIGMEIKVLQRRDYQRDATAIRQHLGYYLLLSLEFLIAVDVIETLFNPEWKELGLLAAMVLLRTLMSVSLHWELKEIENDQPQQEASHGSRQTEDSVRKERTVPR